MAKVTGIGGFFFRSEDPKKLAQWYADHLGVDLVPDNYEDEPWKQEAGQTVFAPFEKDTDYFGNPAKNWMINFRVDDMEGMITRLKAASIEVKTYPEEYPNGKFARIHDPEGNPIELWEPSPTCR